jgi:hypothetical protein
VLRGGSWINNPRRCRSANRNRNAAGNRNNNVGCRVVLCLHFRACPTGSPRTGASTDAPGVEPEVLALLLRPRAVRPLAERKRRPGGSGRRKPNAPPGLFPRGGVMAGELRVIDDFYDLAFYLTGRIAKFPRQHRYSLGGDMESRLQTILAALVRARYSGKSEEKAALLGSVNVELEVLRFQLRLAKDLAALLLHSHGHALKMAAQVGTQVGGWLKSLRRPGPPQP